MDLKLIILCFSLQSVLGQSTPVPKHRFEYKLTENCNDFTQQVSYPFAWRNENIVESHHGVEVKHISIFLQVIS